MGYLFCQKCGGYYELREGESVDDFAHCSCGGSLIYTEKIDGLLQPEINSKKSEEFSAEKISTTTDEKSHSKIVSPDFDEVSKNKNKKSDNVHEKYQTQKQISNLGLIIMFVGLFLLIFAFFYPFLFFGAVINNPDNILGLFVQTVWLYLISIIMMILGAFLFLFFNISMSNTKKRSKNSAIGENLKELPGSYTIFNNVKIPKTRSIIGQLVIGSNGIFIIHNRSTKGKFIIQNDEWWRLQGNKRTKSVFNPAKVVKMNVIDLKRFLNSHNVNVEYMWINPIVTFPSKQYTIEESPQKYNLMPPGDVSKFINSQKRIMDPDLMMRAIALVARHSN
jgi:hypothetical protein